MTDSDHDRTIKAQVESTASDGKGKIAIQGGQGKQEQTKALHDIPDKVETMSSDEKDWMELRFQITPPGALHDPTRSFITGLFGGPVFSSSPPCLNPTRLSTNSHDELHHNCSMAHFTC